MNRPVKVAAVIVVVAAAIGAVTYSAFGGRDGGRGRVGLDPALFPKLASGVGLMEELNCAGKRVRVGGSAFLVGSRVIMTAEHVLAGSARWACKMRVRLDGEWYDTTDMRVWGDPGKQDRRGIDIATLKLSRVAHGHVFRFASESPRRGAFIAALGYPLALPISFSQGLIERKVKQYGDPALAAAVSLEGGNSGGPMVDAEGRVVTVVSHIIVDASQTGTGDNFGGGVDLADWWQSVERDLCRTYSDGGIPGCSGHVTGPAERSSKVVGSTSREPILGIP